MLTCQSKIKVFTLAEWKNIRIDENAHNILVKVKEEMKEEGICTPTLSDAIRWLKENDLKGV